MASLVATSTTSFLHPTLQPRQGILLNPSGVTPLTTPRRSPIDLPAPLPRNNSNYSSNSNSSDSSSPSSSPPRKIRFAPLPDPRRVALPLLPETGDTTDTQDAAAAAALAASSATAGELIALTPVASISGDSTVNGDDSEPRTESSTDLRPNAKRKKSKKWGKRLFGPLLKGGAKLDGLVPLCDSSQSNASTASAHEVGFPLGRRKSTGSTDRPRASLIGSPLTLTRSAEGEGGATAPVRQQRMLNGRVYGARQTLPTTTQEPAFVEWGFGGTGAVTSGGSQYARLQSSNKLSLGTEATTADEDDGSGMAWVAKRRAAREEKARKEKEAALEAERAKHVCPRTLSSSCPIQISCDLQAAAAKEEDPTTAKITGEVNSQQFGDGEARPQTPTPAPDKAPSTLPPAHQSTESRASDVTTPPPPSLTSDHEEHHTVKTISIPGAHPRPHHAHNQSIASPKEHATTYSSPPSSERESEHGSTTEDDDEDSEIELEEDSEEVCPCPNLTNLYSGPDIVPAGGEKDSALCRCGEGLPPYLTLLFGLPTCGRFRFSPIIGRACLVFALALLCPPTLSSFCPTEPTIATLLSVAWYSSSAGLS